MIQYSPGDSCLSTEVSPRFFLTVEIATVRPLALLALIGIKVVAISDSA